MKELSGLDILHNKINVTWGLYDFILVNDMRIHKQPENLNLPSNCKKERSIHSDNQRHVISFEKPTKLESLMHLPLSSICMFLILRRFRILIATLWPVRRCSAILTLPKNQCQEFYQVYTLVKWIQLHHCQIDLMNDPFPHVLMQNRNSLAASVNKDILINSYSYSPMSGCHT